ncbi:MAG TPA: hypothetical protein PLX68_04105, partial [Dermatophilaceae bacterium]|nr:hypothetical protein [Dermatophilaceae bacterium]
ALTPIASAAGGFALPPPAPGRGVLARIGLAMGLMICVGLAVDVLAPEWLPDGVRGWAHANRWVPLVFVLAMLPVGLGLPGGRSPLTGWRTAFLWPTLLAAIALVLGLVSYLRQAGQEAPLLAPLFWTLALFAGNVQVFWGSDGEPAEPPLALELARLAALSASLFTAVEIAMRLSSQRLGRLRLLVDRRRIVIVGLSSETVNVLRAIALTVSPDALLVVLDDGGDDAASAEALALGAVVLPGPVVDPGRVAQACLHRHLSGSRVIMTSRIFVLHDRMQDAIDAARRIEATLDGATLEPGFVCRLMVRIDDPWTAEAWRRERATDAKPWLTDAMSAYEQTARQLVALSGYAGGSPLVIAGRSRLALSVLAEVAHLRRVALLPDQSGAVPEDRTGAVALVGPDASELAMDLEIFQRRFGKSGTPHDEVTTTSSCPGGVSFAEIESVLSRYPQAALVLARPPGAGDSEMGARLASAYPLLRVFSWESDARGVPAEPAVGNLHRIGLSLNDHGSNPPRDNWSRLAELVHEHYRVLDGPQEVPRAVHRPWDQLPIFFQESNIRQVGLLFSAVALPGVDRTWSGPPASVPLPWTDDEVAVLAQAEHESWCAYYRAHGWRHKAGLKKADNPPQDWRLGYDSRLLAPDLLPWAELGADRQFWNSVFVRRSLDLLPLLGYSPTPALHDYRRVGVVSATRLGEGREWTWEGQVLRAEAGDWWVNDERGGGRSVKSESFLKTHRKIEEHTYERVGTVRARRAIPGETVVSPEGPTVARNGDMVVWSGGVTWVAGQEAFEAGYRPVFVQSV